MDKKKKTIEKVEYLPPEPIEIKEEGLPELWQKTFIKLPKAVKSNEFTLNEYIERFSLAFGKVKSEIIKHELIGMTLAAGNMKTKLQELEKEFDSRIYEYLGYPRLEKTVKKTLQEKATKVGKYFNTYAYRSYPRMIPRPVLHAIDDAKKYFQDGEIEVWAVENEPALKDPVIVGKKMKSGHEFADESGYIYYLIGIWDDDIKLEDIVSTDQFIEKSDKLQLSDKKEVDNG